MQNRVFDETNYKSILRSRIREMSKLRKGFSLRKLATRVSLQYSYLSRLLNDQKYHLSEDQLFLIGRALEFFPQELEYLTLLRSYEVSEIEDRKTQLRGKIENLRSAMDLVTPAEKPSFQRMTQEMAYLLDPICVIIHSSLAIPAYSENPRLLCGKLKLSLEQLKSALRNLDMLGFVELANDGINVLKLKRPDTHFGLDHPLMRSHQNLLRVLCASQIMKASEDSRHNFMVTFTADAQAFEKIKNEFKIFIKNVERTVARSKNENTYQLNFDLFGWFQ